MDPNTNSPVVVLREKDGVRELPIWIGPNEASAIAMELAGVKFARPLTHDLVRQIIVGLGARLHQVCITTVENNTYYAELELRRDGQVVQVDARPSDSIAVALRLNAPIFANEDLFPDPNDPAPSPSPLDADRLRDYLKDLDPEDFGKFQM